MQHAAEGAGETLFDRFEPGESQVALVELAAFNFLLGDLFDELDKQFLIDSEPVEVNVDLAFAFSGTTQIELVEASGPVETLYHRHLADHGEGLHYLASM